MTIRSTSLTLTTNQADEALNFYQRYFSAKIIFDCGWYRLVQLPSQQQPAPELGWTTPQEGSPLFQGGASYNIEVEDVDSLYQALKECGASEVMPLENHPWGDRGFAILDPIGLVLYCYHTTEPSDEFKQYYL